MRGVQLAINALLFILVLVLFFLYFNKDGNEQSENTVDVEQTVSEQINEKHAFGLRFVNTDSIWSNYNYVEELRKGLEKKQKQYESEMERKIAAFQSDIQKFQENMMSLSQAEGEQKQKELMMKEQELQQLQQEYNLKLIEEEDRMKEQLRTKISDYLDGYQVKGVDLILDNSASSSVLHYHDSLDITTEVLRGLNEAIMNNQPSE